MENKRGGIEIDQTMTAIIVVVVLVTVGIGAYFGLSYISNISKNLPNLNGTTSPSTEGFALVRYNILTDELEFYNGNKWDVLNSEIKTLGERKINYDSLKASFNGFYFKSIRTNEPIVSKIGIIVKGTKVLTSSTEDKALIAQLSQTYQHFGGSFSPKYSSGAVLLDIVTLADDNEIGFAILNIDNSFNKYPDFMFDEIKKTTNANQIPTNLEMSNSAIAWRDSVFKKPMSFDSKKFCAQFIDKNYIRVDLNKPTNENGC